MADVIIYNHSGEVMRALKTAKADEEELSTVNMKKTARKADRFTCL